MAKIGADGSEYIPNEKPVSLDDVLAQWYGELDKYSFISKAEYAVEGLAVVYADVIKLRDLLGRLDTLIGKAAKLMRNYEKLLAARQGIYEDAVDKIRIQTCDKLIARSMSYQERETFYRSTPDLIPVRIEIRKLTEELADIKTFHAAAVNKYKGIEAVRNDCLLQTSLIRLGYSLKEI